jgi:capsular exopolysaccharide synthesis family protein
MSRIYEALKKAEAERAPIGSAAEANAADSLGTQAVLSDEVTGQAARLISMHRWDGASPTFGSLRLDELRQRCAKPIWDLDREGMVFCSEQSFSLCAEQFRTLRSRLYRMRQERPIRTLLVTSTTPSEGKTFVTLNLGQAIACQHGRRVLLIDADLRASRLHVPLGAPSSPGLSDFLCGEADEYSIIQADAQNNLFFIPAGRPVSNPAELLSSVRLKEFLARLGPVFDWVILDAPPVLPVSDASVLAGLCDGVLFVVRAGSTAFDLAEMACREFRGKNLVGIVLNRVEDRVAAAYGAYSYYGGNGTAKR